MSEDYGLFGKALRALGRQRVALGADSVMSRMDKESKAKKASKSGKSPAQKKIDDEIRRKRKKRMMKRMEVEGGYIE